MVIKPRNGPYLFPPANTDNNFSFTHEWMLNARVEMGDICLLHQKGIMSCYMFLFAPFYIA